MKNLKTLTYLAVILLFMASPVLGVKKFYLNATYHKDGGVQINNLEIRDASRTTSFRKVQANYTLKLENNRKTLFSGKIPLSFTNYIYTNKGPVLIQKQKITRTLWISYRQKAQKLAFYRNGQKIGNTSLKEKLCVSDSTCNTFCKDKKADVDCTCGNNICEKQLKERELCPQDCTQNQAPISENNQPNPSKGPEDSNIVKPLMYVIGTIIGLVILLMLTGKIKIE